MPISILMPKLIFKKYLPPVRSKLVPKLKIEVHEHVTGILEILYVPEIR